MPATMNKIILRSNSIIFNIKYCFINKTFASVLSLFIYYIYVYWAMIKRLFSTVSWCFKTKCFNDSLTLLHSQHLEWVVYTCVSTCSQSSASRLSALIIILGQAFFLVSYVLDSFLCLFWSVLLPLTLLPDYFYFIFPLP